MQVRAIHTATGKELFVLSSWCFYSNPKCYGEPLHTVKLGEKKHEEEEAAMVKESNSRPDKATKLSKMNQDDLREGRLDDTDVDASSGGKKHSHFRSPYVSYFEGWSKPNPNWCPTSSRKTL